MEHVSPTSTTTCKTIHKNQTGHRKTTRVVVELYKACDAAIENVRRKYPQPPGYCIGISAANTIEVFCTGDNNEE